MLKFLLDENLSRRLVGRLSSSMEIIHVSELGLLESLDKSIWQTSKLEGFTIITQDNDFRYLSNTFGCPPKVIKLNCGNRSTTFIAGLVLNHKEIIFNFILSEELCYLEIG